MTQKKKIVLAFSGGLDTSYCIPYLKNSKSYEVHAVSVNTGGFEASDLEELETKAIQLGAHDFKAFNVEGEFYEKCLKYLIFGNVLRNDTYPLSVSAERIFQAIKVAEYAKEINADAVAHGSTGAGNDQVRFDIVFQSLLPGVTIETPIREQALSRSDEIEFLNTHGFGWDSEKGLYSINKGLWGTSIGGKETLGSRLAIPDHAYPSQLQKNEASALSIGFEKGEPVSLNGEAYSQVALIKKLNDIGSDYAIGRDIHVGDTIIGLKGRVAFEAPAALILVKSHALLEKHTLSKWQMHWKKQLGDWYGMFTHEAMFLDPVMRNIENFLEDTQQSVSGKVYLQLHPYRFELEGIESENDLMDTAQGKYGEEQGDWNAEDAQGFIKIMGNSQKIYFSKHPKKSLL